MDIFKNFMSGGGGDFGGGGASGSWIPNPDQSAAETARLARQAIKGQIDNQSPAETARLNRAGLPPFSQSDNNYSHEGNNIVTHSTDEDLNLVLKIQPNILDNYDAVTYHWKLFITTPDSSSTGEIFNVANQTIIAETSVTDLTIDKVEIRGVTTPSVETGTGVSTNVKFEITEPAGAGLVDKMFYQSIALGIGNWAVMPVYLQLQFKNRNPETSEPDEGSLGSLASLKWIWTLKLTRIKANVSTVGTRYEFEAIIYNEFVQSNAIFTLQQNTILNDVDTFSKAMSELQDKLNADQLLKLVDNYSIPDSFKIIVDPKIAEYKITPVDKSTNPRRNDNFVTFENKDASFPSGTAIDKVIDSLLAQTGEYQKSMLNAPTPGRDGASMTEEVNQMKKFWRIITETRPLQFDARRQDVAKEFTIFVVEYDLGILDANVFQTSAPPLTLAAERKRLATYIKKSILKKKYNYIFTGLNDQILNFDLTINNAFANSQARFGGIYQNPAMADKGVVNHEHAKDEAAITNAVSAAISLQNNAKTANTASAQTALVDARTAVTTSELPEATKQRYLLLLEKSKPESRMNFLSEVQTRGGINNDGTLASERAKAVNLAKPISEKITQEQYNFISDVDIESQAAKSAYTRLMENSKGKLRPIARIESMQDRQVGLGVEASSNSGIQKLSNMFSVALHSGLDSSFQRIRMTIKGDPFWLFPQPIEHVNTKIFNSLKSKTEAIDWIKSAHFRAVDSVNYYGTDNFLIIRFRTPRIYNIEENPDAEDPNTDIETFSGIYKVVEVTSKFGVGKFEQELVCILDPEIRLLNVMDQINTETAKKDVPTSPKDLMTTNPFPESAIKTPKIMGSISNKINGLEEQIRDATGQIKTLGSQTVGDASARLTSNVPSPIANLIPGLPPRYT
jgi:hypothetical protein